MLRMLLQLLENKKSSWSFFAFYYASSQLFPVCNGDFCTISAFIWLMMSTDAIHMKAKFTLISSIGGRFDGHYFTQVTLPLLLVLFFQQCMSRIVRLLPSWLWRVLKSLFLNFELLKRLHKRFRNYSSACKDWQRVSMRFNHILKWNVIVNSAVD